MINDFILVGVLTAIEQITREIGNLYQLKVNIDFAFGNVSISANTHDHDTITLQLLEFGIYSPCIRTASFTPYNDKTPFDDWKTAYSAFTQYLAQEVQA